MKISNPAIGDIEFEESQIIHFQEGMLGMPTYKHYLLLQSDEIAPFLRLQSVDKPSLSFLLIDPAFIDTGYRAFVEKADVKRMFIQPGDEGSVVLVVCKIAKEGKDITANLVAPVVINHTDMQGAQLVLLDSPYDVRHSLAEVSERTEA
jgi:flagellar assembly factor FliW